MSILRLLVILMALLVPATATALAHIDPPDPTWAGGYWDDDDSDDAVDAILHYAAVPPPWPTEAAGPCWITIAHIELLGVNGVAPPLTLTDAPRGPPSSSLVLA